MGHLATRLSPDRTNSSGVKTPFSLYAETVLGGVILSTAPLNASCSLCLSAMAPKNDAFTIRFTEKNQKRRYGAQISQIYRGVSDAKTETETERDRQRGWTYAWRWCYVFYICLSVCLSVCLYFFCCRFLSVNLQAEREGFPPFAFRISLALCHSLCGHFWKYTKKNKEEALRHIHLFSNSPSFFLFDLFEIILISSQKKRKRLPSFW